MQVPTDSCHEMTQNDLIIQIFKLLFLHSFNSIVHSIIFILSFILVFIQFCFDVCVCVCVCVLFSRVLSRSVQSTSHMKAEPDRRDQMLDSLNFKIINNCLVTRYPTDSEQIMFQICIFIQSGGQTNGLILRPDWLTPA